MRFAKLDCSIGCWLCAKIVYDIDMHPFPKSWRKLYFSEAVDIIVRFTLRVLSYRRISLKPPLKVPLEKKDEEETRGNSQNTSKARPT